MSGIVARIAGLFSKRQEKCTDTLSEDYLLKKYKDPAFDVQITSVYITNDIYRGIIKTYGEYLYAMAELHEDNDERVFHFTYLAHLYYHTLATYMVGYRYLTGIDGVLYADVQKGVRLLSIAAEMNYPLALQTLGQTYYDGEYVKRNYALAHRYYLKFIQVYTNQHVDIIDKIYIDILLSYVYFHLGMMYRNGYYIASDKTAFDYFHKSALLDNMFGMLALGFIYLEGRGTRVDKKVGYEWLVKAEAAGSITAKHQIQKHFNFKKMITEEICPICIDKAPDIILGCGHMLCRGCSVTQDKCHMCKEKITSRIITNG